MNTMKHFPTIHHSTEEKTPPVNEGETLLITIEGKAKTDYYFRVKKYIVFIKELPENTDTTKPIMVRITKAFSTYAFCEYETGKEWE